MLGVGRRPTHARMKRTPGPPAPSDATTSLEPHELDRRKARFLANMAHQQRTPIATLRTFLEVARRRLQAGHGVDEKLLDRLQTQVDRLAQLVGELSDAGRLDEGRELAVRSVPVDLVEVVRRVAALRDPDAGPPEGRHPLEVVVPDAPVALRGDPDRLAQILGYVLDNALRYTPAGGAVRIALTHDAERATVTVTDAGIGIPPIDLPHVAERYTRGSNIDEERFHGNGLGLAIVREIVARHGGALQVESELGVGTTARVILPLAKEAP